MLKGLLVQKYGGTSVGSVERIEKVAEQIIKTTQLGHQVVVVVSAMAGETNRLVKLGRKIWSGPPTKEHDVLLSTGEQVTAALVAMALKKKGYLACSFTGHQAGIYTSAQPCQAMIEQLDPAPLQACLAANVVPIVTGFQGVSCEGDTTTLGRGGSDTTAMAVAIALNAAECQIYTDVDGVYTTDPGIVPEAALLEEITLEEMLELASLGSKVLHPRAVGLAGKHKTPLRVLSSFNDGAGTLIADTLIRAEDTNNTGDVSMEQPEVSGIAATHDEAKLTLQHVEDRPGVASKILGPVAARGINVDMIVQNIGSNGLTDFTFTVKEGDYEAIKALLEEEFQGSHTIVGNTKVAKVSIVGVGMQSHAGVASKMFTALAMENINIQMISTSEIKISVLIEEKYMELAVRTLHQAFQLGQPNHDHIQATD